MSAELMWTLDSQLAADTHLVTDWPLCRVLLMNDRRFPWLILVPRRAGAVEVHDLPAGERAVLIEEIAGASRALYDIFTPHKMNVAALGNAVRQLHVHVVARQKDDAAQPGLVWASKSAIPYAELERASLMAKLMAAFGR